MLYQKYRPKSLKSIVGQEGTVSSLNQMIEQGTLPHAILLNGPSGCGKTTIARILKDQLGCADYDFIEMNCSDFRGIEMVRDIRRSSQMSPMEGQCRLWIIDECHKLSNDAQNAFLKLLEDTPDHVYFILATTDHHKLLKTILTRCTEFKLLALSVSQLKELITRVAKKQKYKLSEDVKDEIAEAADGSPRKALVILEQVGMLDSEEEQIKAIAASSQEKDKAFELARALVTNPRVKWAEVSKMLSNISEDAEAVRYIILGYARSVLLKGGKLAPRAYMVIDIFKDNFYDSKQAGLAAACWEVLNSG